MNGKTFIPAVSVAFVACCVRCDTGQNDPLALQVMGAFFVGGRTVEVTHPQAGDAVSDPEHAWIEQALVQFFIPEKGHHTPIVLVPGLDLTGYLYLGTPDGRPGWAQLFAQQGFDVYVFNDPLTHPSGGFDISPYNAAKGGDPNAALEQGELKTWTMETVWPRWGFGEVYGTAYEDVRFPLDQVDQFYAALAIRHEMPDGSGKWGSDFKAARLVLLMEKINRPAILVGHSAAGMTVVKAARLRPDLLTGFIMIEPVGVPSESDFPAFSGKFLLGVYGDYIAERGQTNRLANTRTAAQLFVDHDGAGGVISLPEDHAIFGNTHIMMQDNNNDVIAGLIVEWLETQAGVEPFECKSADVSGDCKVDLLDLAILADQWLEE